MNETSTRMKLEHQKKVKKEKEHIVTSFCKPTHGLSHTTFLPWL
jgi:hypothetical protein